MSRFWNAVFSPVLAAFGLLTCGTGALQAQPKPQPSLPKEEPKLSPLLVPLPGGGMLSFMIPDVSVENRSHSRGPVLGFDPALSRLDVPFAEEIYEAARRHAVNPHLVAAVIQAESAYRPRAVSRKGACGLMQLMPQTALRFGLRRRSIFDPARNITAGVRYLRWLAERLGDDVERVVAAYNAGEGAVERFGGVPPFAETRLYVQRVVAALSLRSAINPERRLEAP